MACMMLIGNTKKSFPKIQSNKKFPFPIYNPFKNMNEKTTVTVISGVEGYSVYINNYRIAGNKPWGGGKVVCEFKVDKQKIIDRL